MDKKLEDTETRRAQKRPHSPQKPEDDAPTEPSSSASEDVLQSDAKRDKLLRLLGGKKSKNETAASKWLERVRSREDELKVSTDLESQFNESLTKRLTGASRRHLGIGFKDETPAVTTTPEPLKSDSSTQNTCSENYQGSVVSGLSQPANIPSLSSRNPRPNTSHQPPFSQHRHATIPGHQMYPQIPQVRNYTPPQQYVYSITPPQQYGGYPPQIQNYGGYYCPPQNCAINNPPPPNTIPNPPPPPDDKPPEPKSKNAFYAQFKKAS